MTKQIKVIYYSSEDDCDMHFLIDGGADVFSPLEVTSIKTGITTPVGSVNKEMEDMIDLDTPVFMLRKLAEVDRFVIDIGWRVPILGFDFFLNFSNPHCRLPIEPENYKLLCSVMNKPDSRYLKNVLTRSTDIDSFLHDVKNVIEGEGYLSSLFELTESYDGQELYLSPITDKAMVFNMDNCFILESIINQLEDKLDSIYGF